MHLKWLILPLLILLTSCQPDNAPTWEPQAYLHTNDMATARLFQRECLNRRYHTIKILTFGNDPFIKMWCYGPNGELLEEP